MGRDGIDVKSVLIMLDENYGWSASRRFSGEQLIEYPEFYRLMDNNLSGSDRTINLKWRQLVTLEIATVPRASLDRRPRIAPKIVVRISEVFRWIGIPALRQGLSAPSGPVGEARP